MLAWTTLFPNELETSNANSEPCQPSIHAFSDEDPTDNGTPSNIDNETFVYGDHHTKEITGGPSVSMMTIEDPEACLCGPWTLVMTDPNFESMINSLLVLVASVLKDL